MIPRNVRVSLVTTVLNDREGCTLFFKRMRQQHRPPDEIVVVDGGSTDGTWEFVESEHNAPAPWKIILHREVGCNVARGRNLAIAAASHDIIVSTDIGCDWEPEWLDELIQPLIRHSSVEVVIGSWEAPCPDSASAWAKTEHACRPSMKLEANAASQGVSRSIAYRKGAWERLGGYPEDLTLAADDTCFDRLLKQHHVPSAAAPRIRCYWERPEKLKSLLREEYRNFFGDGEAAISNRHFLLVGSRLAVELSGILSLAALPFASRFRGPLLLVAAPGIALIARRLHRLRRPARQLRARDVDHPWLRVIAFEYLTRLYGLGGYFRGYLRGFRACRKIRSRLRSGG